MMAYCKLYPECEMCLIYFRLFGCCFLFYRFVTLIITLLEKSNIFKSVCYKGAARCWVVIEFRQYMALQSCSDFPSSHPPTPRPQREENKYWAFIATKQQKGLFKIIILEVWNLRHFQLIVKHFNFRSKLFHHKHFMWFGQVLWVNVFKTYIIFNNVTSNCFNHLWITQFSLHRPARTSGQMQTSTQKLSD